LSKPSQTSLHILTLGKGEKITTHSSRTMLRDTPSSSGSMTFPWLGKDCPFTTRFFLRALITHSLVYGCVAHTRRDWKQNRFWEQRTHTFYMMNRVGFELNYGQGQCKYYVYGWHVTVSDHLAVWFSLFLWRPKISFPAM